MPGSHHTVAHSSAKNVAVSRPLLFLSIVDFQFPPPPESPHYPPTALEQFFMLFVVLVSIVVLVLLVIPENWSSKIIKIAFCRKGRP